MSAVFQPRQRPWRWAALWALLLASVATGSLLPAGDLPAPAFAGGDKIEHVFGHGALSAYAAMLFATPRGRMAAALGLLLFGIGLEGAQEAFTATRRADALDVVANGAGVLLGQLVAFTPAMHWLAHLDARMHR